jgi:hypothetical protein
VEDDLAPNQNALMRALLSRELSDGTLRLFRDFRCASGHRLM